MRTGKVSKSQNLQLGVAALLLKSHVQPEASAHVCVCVCVVVLTGSLIEQFCVYSIWVGAEESGFPSRIFINKTTRLICHMRARSQDIATTGGSVG